MKIVMRILRWLLLSVPLVVNANQSLPISNQAAVMARHDSNDIITSVNQTTTQQRIKFLNNLEQGPPWQKLNLNGLLLRGNSHPIIPEIKRRLVLIQDLMLLQQAGSTTEQATNFTSKLETAIKHFQQRHGLKPDGIIGPRTMAWLNVSPALRAQLLTENMHRQQKFFKRAANSYLLVNIPQFQLSLIEQGLSIFDSRVIVGKSRRPTPIIDAEIKTLVVNPAWNVPRSIVRRDLLPKIRNNSNYLAEGNYEVYDYSGNRLKLENFNWANLALGRFPYRLRQKPGPTNTLGRVKLYFENKYSVYLHDTPNKKLFNHYRRAFSSGCVRVEKAGELAKWFGQQRVSNRKGWLNATNNPYKNSWLNLNEPLAIHMVYWTAWIDKANNAQFRTDIYHKESDLFKHNIQPEIVTEIATTVKKQPRLD